MKKVSSHSLEETQKIAHDWLVNVSNKYKKSDEALIVGLSGHLGAGKTAFVKAIAKEFGIKETVTSPTFVLMKIYDIISVPGNTVWPWGKLIHIDAYRLEKEEELRALNFFSLLEDKNNLIMIEWPENVGLKSFKEEANISFEVLEGDYNILIK